MAYLMGIDLGTSSLKVIVIDEEGNLKLQTANSYRFDSPQSGYAEQDPRVWWETCCKTVGHAVELLGTHTTEIKAISFSGQMHGAVFLDREMRPIRPAILHCDARTTEQVARIRRTLGVDFIRSVVLNPIYTGFLLPSLMWVRDNEIQNYHRIRHVVLPKDYLKMMFTGRITSDYSDASATLAFDVKRVSWSEDILDAMEVSPDILPECLGTTVPIGSVTRMAARETGLVEGTMVVNGGADQIMQAIGNGSIEPGMATVNIGSSGQVCFQSDQAIENPALNTNTFCGYARGKWITMGATMTAGLSLGWFNSLFNKVDYAKLNEAIHAVRPGSGGLIFLPYLNGERTPHINPNLSGAFLGINTETSRAQMARAIMEGVTYSLMQCIEVCGELGLRAGEFIASGGGARSAPWLQIQADVYNTPVKVSMIQEQAGLGAAIVAGVGSGHFSSVKQGCQEVIQYKDELYIPSQENHQVYQEYYQLFKDVYRASRDVIEKVTQIGRDEQVRI